MAMSTEVKRARAALLPGTEPYAALMTLMHARIEEHRTAHFNEIKRLFEQYQSLRQNHEAYRGNLQAVSTTALLDKALQAGQITVL